jgi:hypothetical protein
MKTPTSRLAERAELRTAAPSGRHRDDAAGPDPDSGGGPARSRDASAELAVAALYQVHAVGLIRLAVVMLGERPTAEDVVQKAFCGLYRRWEHLADTEKALSYVRSSILNGCRSELRTRIRNERRAGRGAVMGETESADHAALLGEEHREVLAADRQGSGYGHDPVQPLRRPGMDQRLGAAGARHVQPPAY